MIFSSDFSEHFLSVTDSLVERNKLLIIEKSLFSFKTWILMMDAVKNEYNAYFEKRGDIPVLERFMLESPITINITASIHHLVGDILKRDFGKLG